MLTSWRVVSPAYPVVGGDSQTLGTLSSGVAARHRSGLHRENGLPHPGRIVCVKHLPVNGYERIRSFLINFLKSKDA